MDKRTRSRDRRRVPILDIKVNGAGNRAGTALYSITTLDLKASVR